MDDKTTSSPDEYKFTDSDELPEAVPDNQSADSELSSSAEFSIKNINFHRLIKPVVIILAILFIYGIFSFYNSRKDSVAERKKEVAQDVVNAQQEILSALPSPKPVMAQSFPDSRSDQIEQMRSVVQQKLSEVAKDVSRDTAQVLMLKKSISEAQQNIYEIGQNVNQLTIAMQQVLGELQKLKTPKVKPIKKKPFKLAPIYHIRAVVPGRVWLESSDGKSVTLRVGDRLEGYGVVEVISPQQGMVLMSNGSYIQYGINDF